MLFAYMHSKVLMQDQDELTALELAETCGHDEIVKVLKSGQ